MTDYGVEGQDFSEQGKTSAIERFTIDLSNFCIALRLIMDDIVGMS